MKRSRSQTRRLLLGLSFAVLCSLAGTWVPSSARAISAPADAPFPMVERLLARMTLAQKIGQIVMAPIYELNPAWHVGGVILFQPDVKSSSQAQVKARIAAVQHAATVPLLVAADQEGGEVSAIPASLGVPQLLAPRQYGLIGSDERVYHDALASGRALRSLGLNMDLAPVLDVALNPRSPIGDRSYSADPRMVARLGTAAIGGYQAAGIAATAKHFLGLGSVSVDAHVGLPVIHRSLGQLDVTELAPMRAAIRAGVDALMVTHIVIPALDASGTPASLSRTIISGFIRGTLGYHGLIITDSLAMGALSTRVSIAQAAVQAIAAGADMALISADPATIQGALLTVQRAVAGGRLSIATIDAAARHVLTLKARLGLLPHP